jgi:Response regulator containing a CheY-like receiver domain and an HTH DNA-binding domain
MQPKEYYIVAADDHPMILQGLKTVIQNLPSAFRWIGEAHDGKSLRFLIKNQLINTLILDLNLPETNIYRLIKDIIIGYPNVKIIAYSMYDSTKLINDIIDLGAHAFISKSSDIKTLEQIIEKIHAIPSLPTIKDKAYKDFNPLVVVTVPSLTTTNNLDGQYLDGFLQKISLTTREIDVLTLITRGHTNQKISEILFLSKYTIETHRKNIKKKLKIKTSAELIRFAARYGIT